MPIHGTLASMAMSELLQFVGESRKSGCLQIEHDGSRTSLFVREGHVVGCSSDDPPKLLGQFLLYRGAIREADLRTAMAAHETRREAVGTILVEMGFLTERRLAEEIALKAEETALGLFDVEKGSFIFLEGVSPTPTAMRTDIDLRDLLMRGVKRIDDREEIRRVISDLSVPPRRGDTAPPDDDPEIDWPTRQVWIAVDGRRTVDEIAMCVHGGKHAVLECLFRLWERELVAFAPPAPPTASEPVPSAPPERGFAHWLLADELDERTDASAGGAQGAWPGIRTVTPALTDLIEGGAEVEALREAERVLDAGDADAALRQMRGLAGSSADARVRKLLERAERAFVRQVTEEGIGPAHVPVLAAGLDRTALGERSPAEEFLLGAIDGTWDVKSLMWIAPMRAVDVLIALKRLRERGAIELRAAAAAGAR